MRNSSQMRWSKAGKKNRPGIASLFCGGSEACLCLFVA
jgi:hypothetical protein